MCVEGLSVEFEPCRFLACYLGVSKGAFRRPGNSGGQGRFFAKNPIFEIFVRSCQHGSYRPFGETGQELGYFLQKFPLTRVR